MIVILLFFSHLIFGLTSPLSYHGPIAGAIQLSAQTTMRPGNMSQSYSYHQQLLESKPTN